MKEHRRDIAHIQCERGLEALDRGAPDEARASFEAALRKQADLFDARLGLARAKEALGDDGAEAEYRHAMLLEPEHPEPMIGLARLGLAALVAMVGLSFWEDGFVDEEDYDGAAPWEIVQWLDRTIDLDPDHVEAHVLRGRLRVSQYEFKMGIEDLQFAADAKPDDPLPWRFLARAQASFWEYADALESFAHLATIEALTADDLGARADAHECLKDFERAEADLRAVCELEPGVAERHRTLGELFRKMERPADAVIPFTRAVELEPEDAERHHALGLALDDTGRNAEAEEVLSRAIELAPDNARIWYHRGNARRHQTRWADARDDFTRAVELDPLCAYAWNNRGAMNKYLEDTDAALADYLEAVTVKPHFATAHGNLAGIFRDREQWDLTLAHGDAALEGEPDRSDWLMHRGWARYHLADRDGALVDFERAVELHPDDAVAINARGVAFGALGHWDLQIEDARRALALSPESDGIAHNLAVRLMQTARAAVEKEKPDEDWQSTLLEARGLFERLVRERSKNSDDRACLGETKRLLGEPRAGLADLLEAAQMNPKDAEIYACIGRAHTDLGEEAAAELAMHHAIELNPNEPIAKQWLLDR